MWFPWHFHAACDSAKTQHALTSRAPAPALVLLKHTKYTCKYIPAHVIPRLWCVFGVWMFFPPFWTPFWTALPHVCSSNSRNLIVMIFGVGDEDFLYLLCFFCFVFFLFGLSLSVVISSRTGLFCFSLSKISSPLVFTLTGWKCQTAPLGKSRSTVALTNSKHFRSPRLLRRTTPAGTFSAAASESQSGTSHSFTKTIPLLSPIVCIHLSAGRVFVWLATNIVTHLWFFFLKKQTNKCKQKIILWLLLRYLLPPFVNKMWVLFDLC